MKQDKIPKQKEEPNFDALKEACKEYIEYLDTDYIEGSSSHEHVKNAVFEAAIEAFYGTEIWKYINSIM